MNEIASKVIEEAEQHALKGAPLGMILPILRKLSLDDFGLLMISLPNQRYPEISKILPAMASSEIQKKWTGANGTELLKQTVAFTRILETSAIRYLKRPLQDTTILDFGTGYGRLLRMMYYYTDPEKIWGVDAWEKSLATCREAGMLGNLVQSERVPTSLSVGDSKFDVAFAFSVFTHLAPSAAIACLSAVRKHMKPGGLFIPTIRPIEFWPFIDMARNTSLADKMMEQHRSTGIAYLPHGGSEGETYGDTSLTLDFFNRDGWEFLGYERTILDSYQVSVILKAS